MPFTKETAKLYARKGGLRRSALLTWRQRARISALGGAAVPFETRSRQAKARIARQPQEALVARLRANASAGGKASAKARGKDPTALREHMRLIGAKGGSAPRKAKQEEML